jgi:uncharacterized protein (DUF427 family)
MVRATWNDEVIAESDSTVTLEGNHYFPPDSVRWELLRDAPKQSVCPWKGTAGYYDVVVGDEVAAAAAWAYPTPLPVAENITGHVAFWKGVSVAEG